jgi:hypothetical protein
VSIAGVASFGTLSSSPTRRTNRNVSGGQQPLRIRRARTRSGLAPISCTTTTALPSLERTAGPTPFRPLANFLTGAYNNAGFTQTFGADRRLANESKPRRPTFRMNGRWSPSVTLNAGVRYDLQFLETINTDSNKRVSARRHCLVPFQIPAERSSAAAPRLFYESRSASGAGQRRVVRGQLDGPRQPASDPMSALSPTQAGAPSFPTSSRSWFRRSRCQASRPWIVTWTTAYSHQASVEVEHQLGARAP